MNHDLSLKSPQFEPERFRDQSLIYAIIMHESLLSFVEYDGIRALLPYLHEGSPLICWNTIRSDLLKIYQREKSRMKCLPEEVHSARIS